MITRTTNTKNQVVFDISGIGINDESILYDVQIHELESLKADIEAELWRLEEERNPVAFNKFMAGE